MLVREGLVLVRRVSAGQGRVSAGQGRVSADQEG